MLGNTKMVLILGSCDALENNVPGLPLLLFRLLPGM